MLAISIAAAVALLGFAGPASAQTPRVVVVPAKSGLKADERAKLSFKGTRVAGRLHRATVSWGDGKSTTIRRRLKSVSHRYATPGRFTVRVTVRNTRRRTGRTRIQLIVQPPLGVNVREGTIRLTPPQVLAVEQTGAGTQRITLAPGVTVARGHVLMAPLSPALPEGLLNEVVSTSPGADGSTVAITRTASIDQALSTYSVEVDGLDPGKAFVTTANTPRFYRPAQLHRQYAAKERLRHEIRDARGPTARISQSGEFQVGIVSCKARGLSGTPFGIPTRLEAPLGIDIGQVARRFKGSASTLGVSADVEAPITLSMFLSLKGVYGCAIDNNVSIRIPIGTVPLGFVFRPVASLTASVEGTVKVVNRRRLEVHAAAGLLPAPKLESDIDFPSLGTDVQAEGSLTLTARLGGEIGFGVTGVPIESDIGIQLAGNLEATGTVRGGSTAAKKQACLTVDAFGTVLVYAQIAPPAWLNGLKKAVKAKADRAWTAVKGFFGAKPKDEPPKPAAAELPLRIETPPYTFLKKRLFPTGTGDGCIDFESKPDPTPTPTPTATASPSPTPTATASPTPTPTPTPAGRPVAWGFGGAGELGNGKTDNSNVPVDVSGDLADVTQVAAGLDTSYALTASGRVYAWGANDRGQLGDGGTDADGTTVPVEVPLPGGARAKQIAAGKGAGAYALLTDGTIAYWGDDQLGQAGDGEAGAAPAAPGIVSGITGAKAVAAGAGNGYAIAADDTIKAWGGNFSGEIGNGTVGTPQPTPVTVLMAGNPPLERVAQVSGGFNWAIAVTQSGLVYAWGDNSRQQLGSDAVAQQLYATRVGTLADMAQVAAGYDTAYARATDGSAWSWGNNDLGQLGDGSPAPMRAAQQKIPALATGVVDIAGGGYSGYARRADGAVLAWGGNGAGQLGDGTGDASPTPVAVSNLKAIAIAGGPTHALAVRSP